MTQLEPVLTDRTVILTLQNASIQKIASYPACIGTAWSAGAFIYSKIVEPGVIEHYKRGGVAIGN